MLRAGGVFLDGAGGFAPRPRGNPRRFVSPAFRAGPGRRAASRPAAPPAGPGAGLTPALALLQKWQGLVRWWATTSQASAVLLAPCGDFAAHGWLVVPNAPEKLQMREKQLGKKKKKKGFVTVLPLARQAPEVGGEGSGPHGAGEGLSYGCGMWGGGADRRQAKGSAPCLSCS